MSMTAWLALATAVGAVATWLGWRGRRRDDHPWCRRCRYDLVGLDPIPERCPECGRDLGRRGVRHGRRRRRRRLLAAGLALLVVAGSALVTVIALDRAGFDWFRVKPTWWLARVDLGAPAQRRGAIDELTRRLLAGELTARDAVPVVARLVDLQHDLERDWSPAEGAFVEAVQVRRALPTDLLERYLEGAIGQAWRLDVDHTFVAGAPIHARVVLGDARGDGGQSVRKFHVELIEARLGNTIMPYAAGLYEWPFASLQTPYVDVVLPADADAGVHELALTVQVTVIERPPALSTPAPDRRPSDREADVVHEFERTLERLVRVRASPAPRLDDDETARAVERAITIDDVRRITKFGSTVAVLRIAARGLPADVVADVEWRCAGRAHRLESIELRADADVDVVVRGVVEPDDGPVDIALVPSTDAASRGTPTWGRPIVRRVEVEVVDAARPAIDD